ncbi:phage portal protein [Mammaliicoccus sciuri]
MKRKGIIQRARDWMTTPIDEAVEQWFVDLMGGGRSASGIMVNERNAITYSSFWAAVRAITKPIASLPLHLYERNGDGRERAYNHPLYSLLHEKPNPLMTSLSFRDALNTHLLVWGNGYAEIEYGADGMPKALWPLTPDRVTPRFSKTGDVEYLVTLPKGGTTILPKWRMFHLVGPGFDGLKGYSVVRMFRESIGMGMSVTEYGARFFGNGAKPGGVLEHPGKLKSEGQIDALREQWNDIHKGLNNAHRIAILEEGMQYKQIGIPPEDAQFLETRAFQRQEMAAIFGVPPHKIGSMENATFSNIEHQAQEFYTDTLLYWFTLWEQTIKLQIIPEFMHSKYYASFLVDGILRGDIESRYRAYATARQWGWMSANDILIKENMDPLGPEGDVYLMPLNMINAADLGSKDQLKKTPIILDDEDERSLEFRTFEKTTKEQRQIRAAQNRSRLAKRYEQVFSNAVKRYLIQEAADIREAVTKHLGTRDSATFEVWLDEYYGGNEALKKRMKPAFLSLAEIVYEEASKEVGDKKTFTDEARQFMDKYLEAFAERYSGSSKGQLAKIVRDSFDEGLDPVDEIDVRLTEWEERRPEKVAMNETVQICGAIAKVAFAALGISKLRWMALGSDNCPYCTELNGMVVGIEQNFVSKDQSLESEDGTMNVRKPASHPPLHGGCVCQIVAE